MPWAGDAEVKDLLTAELKRASENIPAGLDTIVAVATRDARDQIAGAYFARNYTLAQVEQWFALQTTHLAQSIYCAIAQNRVLFKDDGGDYWETFNRLPGLGPLFAADGTPIVPANGVGLGHGGLLTFRQRYEDAQARYGRWCRW
jgi:hypothetical protein